MPKASVLQFKGYSVDELVFKKLSVPEDQHEFQLNPHFNHALFEQGNNEYDVKLSVEISPDETHPTPFHLRVEIVGHFTYTESAQTPDANLKQQVLKKNTVSILFPFLRQIVAYMTNNANISTLMLPVMNFNDDQLPE